MTAIEEKFSTDMVIAAIRQWLEYGESTFNPDKDFNINNPGHGGYFSGYGWAARCLRYHLEQLRNSE